MDNIGVGTNQSPENTIIAGLLDFPLVDYDEQRDILLPLAQEAVNYYRGFTKNEDHLREIIENNFHQIAGDIYAQINEHKIIE